MPHHKETIKGTSLAATANVPSFGWIAPRILFYVVIGLCALVTLGALTVGDHLAKRAVRENEVTIGNDMVESINRILDSASHRRRAELEGLAGLPCGAAERKLAELETHLLYVRAVALTANGRVYCSSGLGPVDVSLSAYTSSNGEAEDLTLLWQTDFEPGTPVLALFDRLRGDRGTLYVIEGDYLADALAHAQRYGAKSVALLVGASGALDEQGKYWDRADIPAGYSTRVTSRNWPFAVLVASSSDFVSAKLWEYRLAFSAINLLLDGLIVSLYLLAFAPRRLLLKAVLHGLKRGEFRVVYQPIVEVTSRRMVGVEALLRWQHPRWGPISPAVFMDEVESSTTLAEVTQFVLKTALTEMRDFPWASPLRISVNVAPRDLVRKGFVEEVGAAIAHLRGNATLVLELTERFLLEDHVRTASAFDELKAVGVQFAIDDFGTEHSNLDRLGRFPFDYVKIDRQFVSQVDSGGEDLISGIVTLAKHFRMQVIAEGVETEAQHDGLLRVSVRYAQGYLYQHPISVQQLAATAISSSMRHPLSAACAPGSDAIDAKPGESDGSR